MKKLSKDKKYTKRNLDKIYFHLSLALVRGTKRFVSAEYLFGKPKSPEIFGFNCSEN